MRVTGPDHDGEPGEAMALEAAALDHLDQLDEAAPDVAKQTETGAEPVTFLAAHRQSRSRA